ncbi:hypothetical protein CQW23_15186 [Capsicum baccatum]|uniref:C2H2-type domain-containing protein n=1 Tax=Capsicum baccatum TaxID=33114 RepID=A0A2G2WLC3_CAPBA|nr:hypothetical protein CQW23_15186 [Capsicum baccatum]
MINCNVAATPMNINEKLCRDDGSEMANAAYFRILVGDLNYLSHIRPDIAFSVGVVSRFMHNPSKLHLGAAKRILRCIVETLEHEIWYSKFYEQPGDYEFKPWKSLLQNVSQSRIAHSRSFSAQGCPLYEVINNLKVMGSSRGNSLLQKCEVRRSLGKKEQKGSTGMTEKLKASNFPGLVLRIGSWERSRYEGDLVAKCYFAKHKLVWEVLDGVLKNKIEFQWSDIVGLKANCPDDAPRTLDVVLSRQPLFFRETNPQPRKHTLWQATSDFTDGQASTHRLGKHFEKLVQCDPRLNFLSQQAEIKLESRINRNKTKSQNNLVELGERVLRKSDHTCNARQCTLSFPDPKALKKHVPEKHVEEFECVCHYCGVGLKNHDDLQVSSQGSSIKLTPAGGGLSWQSYNEEIPTVDDSDTLTANGLWEQKNITRDSSDYL